MLTLLSFWSGSLDVVEYLGIDHLFIIMQEGSLFFLVNRRNIKQLRNRNKTAKSHRRYPLQNNPKCITGILLW